MKQINKDITLGLADKIIFVLSETDRIMGEIDNDGKNRIEAL